MKNAPHESSLITQSAVDAEVVDVSSSDVVLTKAARGLYVGTQGNVEVVTLRGNNIVIPNASGLIPICITAVLTANTAAGVATDQILVLY